MSVVQADHRAARVGALIMGLVPDTMDESEFDRFCEALMASSVPDAVSAVVYEVVDADDDDSDGDG